MSERGPRRYFFEDGLEYRDHNWSYLSTADRRFRSEITGGLNPAGRTKVGGNLDFCTGVWTQDSLVL